MLRLREQSIARGVISRRPRITTATTAAVAALIFWLTAPFSSGDRWFVRIAALVAIAMISQIIDLKTRPTLSIKQIRDALRHKCRHLRTVPRFRDIPTTSCIQ